MVIGSLAVLEYERISYYELQRATNKFSESNLLGKGSYGFVYEAKLNSANHVGVKVFNLNVVGVLRSFNRE